MFKKQSTKVLRTCKSCGNSFLVRSATVKFSAAKYCSRACYDQSRTTPLKTRFSLRVGPTTETGCILWTGNTNADGYGIIGSGTRKGRNLLAHRISFEFNCGPISLGMGVLHKCDNPPCVNPLHLFLGDEAANQADKVSKGRQLRGESISGSRLTTNKVTYLRNQYEKGGVTIAALAAEIGVSPNAVRCAIKRLTWKHI